MGVVAMVCVRVPRRPSLMAGLRLFLGIVPMVITQAQLPLRVLELEGQSVAKASRVTARVVASACVCNLCACCWLCGSSDCMGRKRGLCLVMVGFVVTSKHSSRIHPS